MITFYELATRANDSSYGRVKMDKMKSAPSRPTAVTPAGLTEKLDYIESLC
ncbi:hypothetical protein OH492_00890 [Vibrio chagasii]|nr:hypothetical protein [Vibrio chagasii]